VINDQETRADEARDAEFGAGSELELLDALLDEEGVAAPVASLPRQESTSAPLSASQRRLWFLHELDPSSHAYTLCGALHLKGALDVEALAAALSGVIARHASLRTIFVSEAGEPRQVVQDAVPLDLRRTRALTDDVLREATRGAQDLVSTPWNLAGGPLLRAGLIELSPVEHALIVVMHHIVADGWSIGVLLHDISALYDARLHGAEAVLEELPLRYADYAAWQSDPRRAGEREEDLATWTQRLAGAPQRLDLPTLSAGSRVSRRGGQLRIGLSPEVTEALKAIGREGSATLYMTLLAAFQILISRSTGQDDFLIGSPVAGRSRVELQGLVGFFVNTLVLRADLSGDPRFRELLGRVRGTVLEALAHQDVPVERIVEALKPEREASGTPLFQILFILQTTGQLDLRLAGLQVAELEISLPTAKFDLTFDLREVDGALTGVVEFDPDRFEEETIRQMADHFCLLLEAIAGDPDARASQLPLLSPAETSHMLDVWSGRKDLVGDCAPLDELFARQAARDPGRVAAVLGDRRMTFGEIDERSSGLAARLLGAGIGEESRVGLCVDRSPELLIGIMAVLKAGAAFVPLDPEQPCDRLAFMLEDAGVRVALATSARASLLAGSDCEIIDLETRWPGVPLPRRTHPEALAYVIYTSGTTGRPKGVMVSHGSLAAAFAAWDRLYDLEGIGVQLQMAALGFDVCIGDVVRALGSGGTLVFAARETLLEPARLYELVRREKVQFGDFVPAIARPLAALARERRQRLDSFRIAVIGADVWTSAEIEEFRAAFGPDTRLGNSFGVTEATIDSACWFVGDGKSLPASPPIGRPMAHTTAYLLDGRLRPVPPGVYGELYLGGPAVARGYLGRPDLTAERFVPDPFGPPGARLYRSGDRAWYLHDGRMVFAGRSDDQVKIRGQRIEPAEVEAALAAQAEVAACAVVARRDPEGTLKLAAYVVPRQAGDFDAERARRHLAERLPTAMIPSAIVPLDALPLSRSGKVDRRKLPEPEWRSIVYEPPANGLEETIAATYREVLGVARVGAADHFFNLGGHSLLATQVVSRIRAALGVEAPLRMIFESPTVRGLAERLAALPRGSVPPAVLPATPEERRIPSYAQRRLWFLSRLDPESLAYSLPSSIHLRGALDGDALRRALTELVRRQETLRTRFVEGPAGPELVVDPYAPVEIPLEDLSGLDASGVRAEAERRIEIEARRPFDLAREPALRSRLFRLGSDEHILLLTLHHIVTDDWSTSVLIKELGALYEAYVAGRESPLGDLAIQYGDWAAWQRRWLAGGEMERQLAHWRAELEGAETLHLAADRPAPTRPTRAGAALTFQMPLELRERLDKLARDEGATLMMALLAGYTVMLARWSGQKDFAVGVPVANRRTVEAEALIGFFVNTLPVRARLAGRSLTFREMIRRTREACLGAYANQDVPFERIVEAVQPDRALGHNPVVQTLFAMQNAPIEEISLPGLELSYDEPETNMTRFDVELFLAEADAGLEGILIYSTELFERDRMLGFIEELARLLEVGSENPDRVLSDLQPLPEAQRHRLLHAWNAASVPYGDPLPVHALFERHARRAPHAVAALFGDEDLTYGELDAKASRLARALRGQGIGVESLVPVCIERSFDMLVALLGILKAGAAYVPLDPEYPPERLALILDDLGADIVLTQARLATRLPRDAARLLRLDADWEEIACEEDGDLGIDVPPDALAYAVYTSGSTGRPKAVAMSHRAIANMLSFQRRDSQAAGGGRTLQFASLSFDVSFQEIFSTLTVGDALVLVTEEERRDAPRLLRILEEKQIERLFLPFVALDQLAETAVAEDLYPAALREIDTAGEQLKITPALRAFFTRLPGCRLVNHYGPSETHLVTTFYLTGDPCIWPALPAIGSPIPNAPLYVLDAAGRLVPPGVPGELCVGGAGLARGYHDRPSLTAEQFVPDPFSAEAGARLYRTGDLARFRPDGKLEFLGRLDHQVKIRGYRVEPGEIEAALAKHPAVRQAVVTAHEQRGGKRLAAYAVAHEGKRVTAAQLREHLSAMLPEYMVPSAIMLLENLPLTPSGKVSRQALPEPDWSAASAHVAPRTPQEELVCGIFAEVLGLARVGATDHFFELGGHSLLATQVLSRLRRIFGVELPLRVLFESPTPAGIASAMARGTGSPLPSSIGPASGARRSLLSYAQRRLWFLHRLEPESSAYNLPGVIRLEGDLDIDALRRGLTEIVRRHESLRTRFVEGPEGPEQVIDAPFAVGLEAESLPAESAAPHETAKRLLSEEAARLFDLARGPVMRARLLRLGPREHLLSIVVHHISSDGWSMGVLLRELGILYAATVEKRASPLAEPEIQYADWAVWQRDWLEQGELDRQMACWRAELENAPPALELPVDRARPATGSWKGETLRVAVPSSLVERVARLARSEGATLQMALLAGYAWTLMRHADQREIVIGIPVANRRAAEAEDLVGFFVNTLAVRVRADGSPTFRELLARVRQASLLAYANQDVPFERVVEELQPARALNRAPLFQTAFALNSQRLPNMELPGLRISPFEISSGTAKFDLMLLLGDEEQGLAGAFEYSTDLFERETIEAIFSRFARLLVAACEHPDAPLAALSLLDEAERCDLLRAYAEPVRRERPEMLLHELFERQAARTPQAPAVAFGDEVLSYTGLEERARRLAGRLREMGISAERRVAILLDRSLEAVVALLAVLEAGGAYVPLDPGQPEARLRWLMEDSGAALVISESRMAERLSGIETPVLLIDRDERDATDSPSALPERAAAPANLAYVIYTSGSTGRPKGVGIEHRQIAGYVAAVIERLGIEPGWRFGMVSTLAADLGHTALFPCLATGGCLLLLPPALSFDAEGAAEYFERRPVDCVKIVPSHLQALLAGSRPERVMPRRLLILGGEATPGARLAELRALAPQCRVANHYGPTEATVGAVAGFPEADDAARPLTPLGLALGNAKTYLLDEQLQPVPSGMPGELYLGGAGVARGYVGASDLTAARFVPDPFSLGPGARMYRTGDRARRLRDGRLEFLGRADTQVKVRGFRVEPREVEEALKRHPEVRDAAVVSRPDAAGNPALVAYVVPEPRVAPTVHGLVRRALPNGMAVAELNRHETDYIYREIFEQRAYLRHGIALREGDTVVDVGANIGLFSLFASLVCPGVKILAFEPNPHLQPILRANLFLFAPDAVLFAEGLSDAARNAEFTFFPGFSLLSGLHADAAIEQQVVTSFLENQAAAGSQEAGSLAREAGALLRERFAGRTLEITLRTLSEVLAEQRVERVGLLKINAEKAELEVLRGLGASDWARTDQAVVEVDRREHLAPIVALFEENGFQVLVDQDPLLARTDLHYVYATRQGSDRALSPGAPAAVPPAAPAPAILTAATLRLHLGLWLPEAMIPAAWAFLEAMPLTANGKLDRARLPEPEALRRVYAAPRGDLERRIAAIWEEALGLEQVGAHDNFFDLGGHSLLLARVHTALRRDLATEIGIVELFRYPTVASLAARLSGDVAGDGVKRDRQRGLRRRAAAGMRAKSRAAADGAPA